MLQVWAAACEATPRYLDASQQPPRLCSHAHIGHISFILLLWYRLVGAGRGRGRVRIDSRRGKLWLTADSQRVRGVTVLLPVQARLVLRA